MFVSDGAGCGVDHADAVAAQPGRHDADSLDKPDGTLNAANSTQYVFLYNVSGANKETPVLTQVIQQTNAHVGLVFSPDGSTLYAAGGNDDAVYVYARTAGTWAQLAKLALGHSAKGGGLGVQPNASGVGISVDGKTLGVANNYNDSTVKLASQPSATAQEIAAAFIGRRDKRVICPQPPFRASKAERFRRADISLSCAVPIVAKGPASARSLPNRFHDWITLMRQPFLICIAALLTGLSACNGNSNDPPATPPPAAPAQRAVIMVWDGLRPDSINPVDTPNLYALRQQGVQFADNHSTFPTFTMMNGSSFATGSFPKTAGFYGNTFWTPPQAGAAQFIPVGKNAGGGNQDYVAPVFTEDYAVLTTLNDYYGGQLLLVKTLFKTAQDAGLKTLAMGKSGAAYIQDLNRGGLFVDENAVLPLSLATEMQAANFALPANTVFAYPSGTITLSATNGSPTARAGALTFALPNGIQARDATDSKQGAPEDAANKYMMSLFTQYILPKKLPDLSLIWFRTPDNTEHAYGPGSANYRKALASQDARLGELQAGLKAAGLDATTNIVVVSDHGHSNVSGPTQLFPLRAITASTSVTNGVTNAVLGQPDAVKGYSVSGDVRSADLLTYAGFKAYDGSGCSTTPMAGIKADGSAVYPVGVDTTGALCGTVNVKYQAASATLATPVASFRVPAVVPATGIVIATNGGSDYFYIPDHDAATVANLVRFLQSREEFGAVFVDSRYGPLPGTLPMAMVNLENSLRQNKGQPDVVVSFNWDSQQLVNGMPGTEFESFGGNRGMHGSFSPIDVHNTLVASGPAFRTATTISNPTGNVDVAPTVAQLFGLAMPQADGRILNEALVKPASGSAPSVQASVVNPAASATGIVFKSPVDPTGATVDASLTAGSYSINLVVKDLTVDGKTYRYFDYAQAVRN